MGGTELQAVVRGVLDEFDAALRAKDPNIARRFDASAIFIGSEPGEMARGHEEIAALLDSVLKSPNAVRFAWASIDVNRAGETAWFFADGEVVISNDAGETRRPYGLTGVLVEGADGWRWRLFHGSEPWTEQSGGV
jgi:ketosteroid isomerase-like protein